jgi:uncharacterized protein with GYD domain
MRDDIIVVTEAPSTAAAARHSLATSAPGKTSMEMVETVMVKNSRRDVDDFKCGLPPRW